MKIGFLAGTAAALFLLAGCGQKVAPTDNPTPPAPAPSNPPAATPAPTATALVNVATPVMQPILAVWQEGDRPRAVKLFLEANWNARPIFPAGMSVNLTEAQFAELSDADRQLRFNEITAQLDLIKHLASDVAQAGRDAAAKGDTEQAKKYFAALRQCGAAFDSPDRLKLLQMVGRTMKKIADNETAKIGQ